MNRLGLTSDMLVGRFGRRPFSFHQIERFHTGGHRNAAQPQSADDVALQPGAGVHVPAFRQHVVDATPGQVALSLAVAVRTDATLQASAVHRANARIRRLGLSPRPPGGGAVTDELKPGLVTTTDRVLRAGAKRATSAP